MPNPTPETIWRGLRYWVQEPKGNQHCGWNNWFVPYTLIKTTAKKMIFRGDLWSFIEFNRATGYPCGDKDDVEINRAKFEEAKIYHSRVHEYFYKTKPAVDPERPRRDPFWRIGLSVASPSAFAVLGLPSSATQPEIKRAYKRLAKSAHPDGGGTHEAFLKLNQAYEQAMRMV